MGVGVGVGVGVAVFVGVAEGVGLGASGAAQELKVIAQGRTSATATNNLILIKIRSPRHSCRDWL